MAHRSHLAAVSASLLGAAFLALMPYAASGQDRRPTGPTVPPPPQSHPQQPQSHPDRHEHHGRWRPPYCPPPAAYVPAKPNISFDIQLLSVDAGRADVSALSAFLAVTSNPDDQRAGLQARAETSSSLTLRVKQDGTGLRELGASAMRVSAHPHLDARGGEAVDFIVEQAPAGASPLRTNAYVSLVFDNGDTRLLSDTARPDGTRHLVYATVFFTPRRDARR